MDPLAGLEAFGESLGRDLSPTDVRALRALDSASGIIRSALGQAVSAVYDDVVVLDGLGNEGLLLPQIPVAQVTDVTILGTTDEVLELTEFYVDPYGILHRTPALWWPTRWPRIRGNVQVTYDHGYETIPDAGVALTLSIAGRLYSADPTGGAVASKTIGGASVTYADASTTGSTTGLTAIEERILAGYPWEPSDIEAAS